MEMERERERGGGKGDNAWERGGVMDGEETDRRRWKDGDGGTEIEERR